MDENKLGFKAENRHSMIHQSESHKSICNYSCSFSRRMQSQRRGSKSRVQSGYKRKHPMGSNASTKSCRFSENTAGEDIGITSDKVFRYVFLVF